MAFEPNPLPADWTMPQEFWPLVRDAWGTIRELNGIGRVLPDPTILLKPLEDREAIQSSRMEGTFATARELLLFEKSPSAPGAESERANNWREVWNYKRALRCGATSELPIGKRLLRELHRYLMNGVRGTDKDPGEFRRVQVGIRGTRDNPHFVPPPPNLVMPCLDSLEAYIHATPPGMDKLVDSFLVHYQFETIHPFRDGNGRVGRLLLALMIQQRCDLNHPWLFVSQYFEKHQAQYFDLLFSVSTTGNWSAWIEFCLRATIDQAQDALNRCQRLLDARAEIADRISQVRQSNKLLPIVDLVLEKMFISVNDVVNRFRVTYPTADKYLNDLVTEGILRQLADYSPKNFFSPALFAITYGDLEHVPQP